MTAKARKILLLAGILTSVISACLGLETQHSNHLGWALLLSGTIFSAGGVITLGVLFLKDDSEKPARRRSFWLPLCCVMALSLITPLEYLYMNPILARSDHVQDIGLILFAGGLCFYLLEAGLTEGRSLPPSATAVATKRPGFKAGITRWICRPAFAGPMLLSAGLSVGYSSLIGLLAAFVVVLPGLVFWLKAEDRRPRVGIN